MYVLEWRIVSALTRGLFWCLFPELRSNEGNKYQNNPRVSAETVRHESTYIILFLTRHNESINDYKNDEFYTSSRVALARFSFCWWRHNRLLMTSQWPGNCDAITWIVISNSIDIDFIHGDIHDRSCKKSNYVTRSRVTSLFQFVSVPCGPAAAAARNFASHDDVIKWKYFPRHWPVEWGIHRSPHKSL